MMLDVNIDHGNLQIVVAWVTAGVDPTERVRATLTVWLVVQLTTRAAAQRALGWQRTGLQQQLTNISYLHQGY